MKLTRRQLRHVIAEAGVIPNDVLEYFINGKGQETLPRLHVQDVHEVPDELEHMDPHETYGIGFQKGKEMQCDDPGWSQSCVKNDMQDHATPGEAFGVGYAAGRDESEDKDEKVRKLIDDFAGEAIAKTAALRGVTSFGDALDEFGDDIDTDILTRVYRSLLDIARDR